MVAIDTEGLVDCGALEPTALLGAVLIELEINNDGERAFEIYSQMADKSKEFVFPLGVYLAVLKSFFVGTTWTRTVKDLSLKTQACVLEEAGYLLQALGFVQQALVPKRKAIALFKKLELWSEASRAAARLSELYLYTEKITDAITVARHAAKYAEKAASNAQKIYAYVKWANAQYANGDLVKASAGYASALKIGALLDYSLYLYCEFLWAAGRGADAKEHLLQLMRDGRQHTKGVASILLGIIEENESLVEGGVQVLRESGVVDELPRGLCLAARYFRCQGKLPISLKLAIEAREISQRTGMRLFTRKAQAEVDLLKR